MVRLVIVSGTGVEVDPTGKKTGRGAYLCPNRVCWDNALKTGRLAQALRANISSDNIARLQNNAAIFKNEKSQA